MINFNLRARFFLTFIFITAIPAAVLFAMGCMKEWNPDLALATFLVALVPLGGVIMMYLSTGFSYNELTDPYK